MNTIRINHHHSRQPGARVVVPESIANKMVSDYGKRATVEQLVSRYGYGGAVVRRTLVSRNVRMRTFGEHCKKHTLNEQYFDVIDSYEKAYILGFIYADGNVYRTKPDTLTFQIKLQIRDRSVVELMRKAFESSHPIFTFKSKTSLSKKVSKIVGLTICNKRFCQGLIRAGSVPCKSLILDFPDTSIVPERYLGAFVLGYFDGDGSVVHNTKTRRWTMNLCGTDEFLTGLSLYLQQTYGMPPPKLYHHRNQSINMYRMGWCGGTTDQGLVRSRAFWYIYHLLYDGHNLGLPRKKHHMDSIVPYYKP